MPRKGYRQTSDHRARIRATMLGQPLPPTSKRELQSRRLKRIRGITLDDYDQLLTQQGGGCAACGEPPTTIRLHIDHDHVTGQIRGLLCRHCNSALGYGRDDPKILRGLADYLERGPLLRLTDRRQSV